VKQVGKGGKNKCLDEIKEFEKRLEDAYAKPEVKLKPNLSSSFCKKM